MSANSEKVSDTDEFLRSITLSVEELRRLYPWAPWVGAHSGRWFESPNVIDLWSRLSEARRIEIYRRLRHRRA